MLVHRFCSLPHNSTPSDSLRDIPHRYFYDTSHGLCSCGPCASLSSYAHFLLSLPSISVCYRDGLVLSSISPRMKGSKFCISVERQEILGRMLISQLLTCKLKRRSCFALYIHTRYGSDSGSRVQSTQRAIQNYCSQWTKDAYSDALSTLWQAHVLFVFFYL